MAKLVNQPEGGMAGAQKKFSLLIKGKLCEEITSNYPHIYSFQKALKSVSRQSPVAMQTNKGKTATLPG